MTGGEITNNGRNMVLNRAFKSSPDYTHVSQFSIGTGTTTPAKTDTALENVITNWAGGSSNFKNIATGYPTFDTANKKVTTRGIILSTEATGNDITEVGEFNADGTELMFSHDVFTAISKTASIEVAIEIVHKIVDD